MKRIISSSDALDTLNMGALRYGLLTQQVLMGACSEWTLVSYGISDTHRTYSKQHGRMVTAFDHTEEELDAAVRGAAFANVHGHSLMVLNSPDFSLHSTGLRVVSGGMGFNRTHVMDAVRDMRKNLFLFGVFEVRTRAESELLGTRLPKAMVSPEAAVDAETQPTDPAGGKAMKRAKKVIAPTVLNGYLDRPLCGIVLPEGLTMDGWFLLSEELHHPMVADVTAPAHGQWSLDAQRAYLRKQRTYNGSIFGDIRTTDGMEIGMLKGQVRFASLPEGVDFITTEDNVKKEMFFDTASGVPSWVCIALNPQGSKPARLDAQAYANIPQLWSHPALRKALVQDRKAFMKEYLDGNLMALPEKLAKNEFVRDDSSIDGITFSKMVDWKAAQWVAAGLDYRYSPFLMRHLGHQWTAQQAWDHKWKPKEHIKMIEHYASHRREMAPEVQRALDRWFRTVKVPLPHARRIQVVSEDIANFSLGEDKEAMASEYTDKGHVRADLKGRVSVPKGQVLYLRSLDVLVVCNEDYEHVIVPSHGGSDADDFYLALPVVDSVNKTERMYLYRNPIGLGEYSDWEMVNPVSWMKSFGSKDEDGRLLPTWELSKKRRRTQILEALASGETEYLSLPTEVDDEATPEDDKIFLQGVSDGILNRLIASGKGVDYLYRHRLGADDDDLELIPGRIGAFSKAKMLQGEACLAHSNEVEELASNVELPEWLAELGTNEFTRQAEQMVRRIRRAGAQAANDYRAANPDADSKEVMDVSRMAVDKVISGWLRGCARSPQSRAMAVMALWQAFLRVPEQKSGRINDVIFFTSDFLFDSLMESLQYLGVARKFIGTTKGVVTVRPAQYTGKDSDGYRTWRLVCMQCNTAHTIRKVDTLARYHENRGVCSDCR